MGAEVDPVVSVGADEDVDVAVVLLLVLVAVESGFVDV